MPPHACTCTVYILCFIDPCPPPAENEVNVWDEGADAATNIRIDPKKGVVAATFNKLVEKLTSERDHGEGGERKGEGRGGKRRESGGERGGKEREEGGEGKGKRSITT